MNIFHFPVDDKPQTIALFSIANIIEPGIFDLNAADIDTLKTPGISLFIRLPICGDNHQAYETFIRTAKKIATDLGGELCDETRNPLTQQAISYKKELISKLNFDITKAQKLADMGH
jgi:cell division protein ZipA